MLASFLIAFALWLSPGPPRVGILPGEVPEDVSKHPKPTKPTKPPEKPHR